MLKLSPFFIVVLIAFLVACKRAELPGGENPFTETTYFCGAEKQGRDDYGNLTFKTDNVDFLVAENQSSDYAFEGEHAVKLDQSNPYGMSLLLTDIKQGEYFRASVWQKEDEDLGALICAVSGKANFSLSSVQNGIFKRENGWMKHIVQFKAITALDSVKFFVFLGSDADSVYFDNLTIERFSNRPNLEGSNRIVTTISLPDSSSNEINGYIENAITKEVISKKNKSYVSGHLLQGKQTIPVELRLKGDWTDHLISGNPSYRIKTNSGFAFKGLRSFSIQHPNTRNYMHEWFIHKLCDQEDLLSTTYSFINIHQDGINQGVYALEEHFDKQLLEHRKRREGPILKIDESGFWALAIFRNERDIEKFNYPFYEAAPISCFKEKRTRKSKTLSAQFQNGAILLELFKNNAEHPELIFDIEQIATYYALMDIGNINHSLAWHNRRFYYNPVTAKLEHVGFDMIPMIKPYNPLSALVEFEKSIENSAVEERLNHNLYLNTNFRKIYTEKLRLFSSEAYLDNLFQKLDSKIVNYEKMLQEELSDYYFDRSLYYEKARLIRNELTELDEKWDVYLHENDGNEKSKSGINYTPNEFPVYVKEISVNGYVSKIDSARYLLEFENYHVYDTQLIGYSNSENKDVLIPFDQPVFLNAFTGENEVNTTEVFLDEKPSRFFFETKFGDESILERKKFIKWKRPNGIHPRISLAQNFKENHQLYQLKGNTLTIKQGDYILDELIYVPERIEVKIEAGVSIDFIKQGGLIVNDNIVMKGRSEKEIELFSSDSSAQGITILKADTVIIEHTSISGFNTLDYNGWTLTGALTIYESEVIINHLRIKDNECEDALNIIRSNFEINDLYIANTASDGFDADFCTGIFKNAHFSNTGNDCIDFSGSNVFAQSIEIENSGDKGISGGEQSTLRLEDVKINGALMGIASKDSSTIIVKNMSIKNTAIGVAAFQKKSEYGGSRIELENVTEQYVKTKGIVEKGSVVVCKGKEFIGRIKFDIEKMYERFDK